MCSVAVYDARLGKWFEGTPMGGGRAEHSCSLVEGKLYVVGPLVRGRRSSIRSCKKLGHFHESVSAQWDGIRNSKSQQVANC